VILEVAQIRIRAGQGRPFEAAFRQAEPLLQAQEGYVSHELQRGLEQADRYMLLVRWRRLEDHTVGFRGSERFQEWRRLLGPFFDGLPTVAHYQSLSGSNTAGPAQPALP